MIKHAVQNLTDLTVREIIQCVRHIADVDVQRFKLCVDDLCRTFVGMDHAEHRLLVVIVNAAALDKELCLARNIVGSVASQNLIIARFAVPALMFGIITLKHVLRNLERENLFLTGLKQNLTECLQFLDRLVQRRLDIGDIDLNDFLACTVGNVPNLDGSGQRLLVIIVDNRVVERQVRKVPLREMKLFGW